MRDVPKNDGLPIFGAEEGASTLVTGDDELCDRIRADARRLVGLGRTAGLARYLDAIPGIEGRPAVLDSAIVATLELAVAHGVLRDEAIEAMIRDHPALRTPILAADFLDQTLGTGAIGSGTIDDEHGPDLPFEIGPALPGGHRRYELRTRLAEGASGIVYRAIDRAVSTPDGVSIVAVKCLRDPGFRLPNLFKLEAQRARRVEHASVARVLDAGEDARAGEYLVFEYCEGATLEQWMTRRGARPAPAEAVALVLAIAEGVSAVHRAGFCHGDMHPGNVIVSRDGVPRLIDFGASRSDAARFSASPRPIGALGFAAPELFRSASPISGQGADAYAVAGLLFWMLTGEPPNGATVEDAEATIGGERRVSVALLDGQTRDLRAILARALSADVTARYPTIDAFAEDLRRGTRFEPLAWSPGTWRHRAGLAVRRAKVAYALAAGTMIAALVGLFSLFTALYVSNRSALAEAQMAMEANRSALSAVTAQREAAVAQASRMDMARLVASSLNTLVQGAKANNESIRWLAPLVIMERYASDKEVAEPVLAAESKKKRIELAAAAVAGCIEKGRIDNVGDLFVAGALGVWRLEEEELASARTVLTITRAAAQRMLIPTDPAAVRLEVYWAIATVLAGREGHLDVPSGETQEAERILRERAPIFAELGPKMKERFMQATSGGAAAGK